MSALRALLAAWRGDRYAHGFVLLLPAIQYGFNYFVSVAALLFVLSAVNTRSRSIPCMDQLPIAAVDWIPATMPAAPNRMKQPRITVAP